MDLSSRAMNNPVSINTLCIEVTCSICKDYFSDPVILECGHNFCHHCILKYWREFVSDNTCPQCKVVMDSGSLLANKTLEKFVGLLKRLSGQTKEVTGGSTVCDRHQKPWDAFCRNDQILICSACAESTEHEDHDIISLEQAAEEFKHYFCEFLDTLKTQRSMIMEHKTRAEKESQDVLKGTELIKKRMETTFQELRQFLEIEERYLQGKIRETEKEVIQKREEYMDRLFRDLSAHDKLVRDLQEKYCQPAVDLLQDVSSTMERCEKNEILQYSKPFSIKRNWELWDTWDVNMFLENAIKQFQDSVKPGLSLQQALLTLDSETAHPRLLLSKDCKSVTVGAECQNVLKHRKRFDTCLSVLANEEFTDGRTYWDVSVGSEGDWMVGIARKIVKRKGPLFIGPRNGVWAIGKRGDEYIAPDPPNPTVLKYNRLLKRIRVLFNYTGKHVTFFDADETHLIHHSYVSTASESFVPFFYLSEKAVLTLTP